MRARRRLGFALSLALSAPPASATTHYLGVASGNSSIDNGRFMDDLAPTARSVLELRKQKRSFDGSFQVLSGTRYRGAYENCVETDPTGRADRKITELLKRHGWQDGERLPSNPCSTMDDLNIMLNAIFPLDGGPSVSCVTNAGAGIPLQAIGLDGKTKALPKDPKMLARLGDFDGDHKMDVAAPSERKSFLTALNSLLENSNPNDRILLDLNDHGSKDEGKTPAWRFHFSVGGESITAAELHRYLEKFNDKGVTVNLKIDSCYSGGFVNELTTFSTRRRQKNITCVTSSTGAESPGGISLTDLTFLDPRVGGDALSFASCYSATQSIGSPAMSSLDTIAARWERDVRDKKLAVGADGCETQTNASGEAAHGSTSATACAPPPTPAQTQALRAQLIAAFRKKVIEQRDSCNNLAMKWKRATSFGETSSAMGIFAACLAKIRANTSNKSNHEMIDPFIAMMLDSIRGQTTVFGDANPFYMRQMKFLRSAPAPYLNAYRNQYCCLRFNYRTNRNEDPLCN